MSTCSPCGQGGDSCPQGGRAMYVIFASHPVSFASTFLSHKMVTAVPPIRVIGRIKFNYIKKCVLKKFNLLYKYKPTLFNMLLRWLKGFVVAGTDLTPFEMSLCYWPHIKQKAEEVSALFTCALLSTVCVGPDAGRLQAQEFPDPGRHMCLPCCYTQCVSLGRAWVFCGG